MRLSLFFIRHKPTGLYMPQPGGHYGRGGTFDEPTDNGSNARIFRSHRAAKLALNAWLKGKWKHTSGVSHDWEGNPDYYEDVEVLPQPHRNAEDMEIIEKEIEL